MENDEVPGPSSLYCLDLQLQHLCCNPAARSVEHCGDIVSGTEDSEEEAVVGGRREREREKFIHNQEVSESR